MTNEITEFKAYTDFPCYTATGKRDTSYLGRFTYSTLTNFEGLTRILTIIARGYLFENDDADPYTKIEYARCALLAWCSYPDKKNTPTEKSGLYVNFRCYASAFPSLVNEQGEGWFYRHVTNVIRFVKNHPELVSKSAQAHCETLSRDFSKAWKKEVLHLQVPPFSVNGKGAWLRCLDKILADALELGPLQNKEIPLNESTLAKLTALTPKGLPEAVLPELYRYYLANRQPDSEWVILPVSAFDAYFGGNSFSKKWLPMLTQNMIERKSLYGVCKYRIVNV